MSSIKCLACNQANNAGDLFCASCGSSLHLKLCPSCEAVNNPVAQQCHACGTPLPAEAPAGVEAAIGTETVAQPAYAEAIEFLERAPFHAPRAWQGYQPPPPSGAQLVGRWTARLVLVALPVAAIAVWAHEFYSQRNLPVAAAPAAAPVAAAPVAAAAPVIQIKQAPIEVKQAAVEPKPAPLEVKTAPAPVKPAPVAAPKAATIAPKPAAVEPAVRGRITHTRAQPAPEPIIPAARATVPASAVIPVAPAAAAPSAASARQDECPEPTAALGLCSSQR